MSLSAAIFCPIGQLFQKLEDRKSHETVSSPSKRFGRLPYPAPFPFGKLVRVSLKAKTTMLNKMNILLAATAAVALSAGAAIADPSDHHGDTPNFSVTVGNQGQADYYGNGYNYGYDDGYARRERDAHYRSEAWRAQPVGLISVGMGDIAFAYTDGYWDNGHTWHRWNHRSDYYNYRSGHRSRAYSRSHDRYDNDGWQR